MTVAFVTTEGVDYVDKSGKPNSDKLNADESNSDGSSIQISAPTGRPSGRSYSQYYVPPTQPRKSYGEEESGCSNCSNYKRPIKITAIILVISAIVCAVITLLLWTAGYARTYNFQQISDIATCYVQGIQQTQKVCSYQTCAARNSNNVCTFYSTNEYTCFDVVGTYVYSDVNNVNHTFIVAYNNVQYTSDAITSINQDNDVKCWYDTQDFTQVWFTNPDPLPFYIAGLVFSAVAGISLIGMVVFIVIYQRVRYN